jgi:hypothetical protein
MKKLKMVYLLVPLFPRYNFSRHIRNGIEMIDDGFWRTIKSSGKSFSKLRELLVQPVL